MSTLSISAKVSDSELSDTIARDYLGWTPSGYCAGWWYDPTRKVSQDWRPSYATDLNALLPLLETAPGGKHTITYVAPHHSCRWWRYEVAIHTATAPDYVGRAETLARAGCLALLASRGVTILP